MKLTQRQMVKHLLLFLILSCFKNELTAQQTLTTINGWNAYVHLPDDYNSTTQDYPTIVFVSGVGEVGSNPSLMLNYGPSYFIAQGHNMQFTVNGVLEKPIVISMQPPAAWPVATSLNRQLDSIFARWRVDPDRLALTGLSMGGWSWDSYVTANETYSMRPASLVVMSAPPPANPISNFSWYAANGGKWWGFEGTQDYRQMDLIRDEMNNTVAGSARYTQYVGGHCCWNTWYNPSWTENGESIYTWMLKQVRNASVTNTAPVANAGNDITVNFPSVSAVLNGSGSDADGTITSYSWTKISGPLSFNILNANQAVTTVLALLPGTYQFELRVTDDGSFSDRDTVTVNVNGPLGANQAPNASAGNDQTITLPTNSVSLNGSGSSDADGTISSYNWTKISGPSQFNIQSPNSANTTVSNLVSGSYRFRLTVTDAGAATDSDTVTVSVNSAGISNCGCDKTIQPGVDGGAYINGNTIGVQPGDKVCVTAGNYRYINMFNFNGTAQNPIEIINCGGQVIITGPTYGITMTNSTFFRLTGTGATGIQYGFKVKGDSMMTTGIGISTRSSDFEVDHIEIYKTAVGVICKTNPTCDPLTWEPAFTMQNISFHDISMRNIEGEGFYVGHTSPNVTVTCSGVPTTVKPQKIKNLKIYNCITDSTGWDGIQVASAPENCEVYNNTVINYGTRNFSSQQAGILFGGICNGKAYNNYVEQGSGVGLAILGVGYIQAYNNVLVNCGYDGTSVGQDGIFIDDRPQVGYPNLYVNISSNTIVAPRRSGIRLENTNHSITSLNLIHNNLIADPGSNAGALAYIDVRNGALSLQTGNANQPTIPGAGFVSPATSDYHLLPTSPAINIGISLMPLNILTDKDGLARPIGLFYDAGAYEYNVGAPPPNIPPTANADTDKTITLPTNSVTLNGSATDIDGTVTGYSWTKISGPTTFNIANATSAQTAVNNLVQGTYQFRLQATDDDGASDADTVVVTVNSAAPPPNQAPVANAGNNISITLPTNSTTLNGSGTDADGTISGYSWTKISGPTTFNIANASAAQTAVNNLVQGSYQFRLVVTDDDGATGADTVSVTVNAAAPPPNQAPVANAGNNISITLPTNNTTLNGSGTDADGTISSYSWTKISGPATFNIANATSAQTAVNNLVQGTYQFRLVVTDDDGATDADTVNVTVNAAAPPPPPPNQAPVANAGNNISITLPTNSTTLNGSGTDADGTISSYGWTKISGPATFNIANATSAQTAVNNLVQGTYQFRLVVTDDDGATGADTVSVTVNAAAPPPPPPNQPPVANAGNDQTLTLPTNSVTLVGTGTDSDGTIIGYSWSKISGPTSFNFSSPNTAQTAVNNLVQGVYRFQLQVTDNMVAIDRDTVTITVNAAPPPPNQAPVANAGNDQIITLPTNTVTLNGSATDSDGTISTYSWTKVSGPAQFSIVNTTAAQTAVNNLVQGVYQFQLSVTDDDGATDTDIINVTVNAAPPPANQVPVANAGNDITITLPTNSVTLNGSGIDPDGSITGYSWIRTAGPAQYSIASPSSAQTAVNNLAAGVYLFQLTVVDNDGATDIDVVSVTVNAAPPPPNQAPVANAGADITLTLPTNTTTLSGSGTDSDGSIVNYNWAKTAGPAQYSISNTAAAQTALTNLVQGVYQFRLTVTDNDGATDTDLVTVTVNAAPPPPANIPPTANAGNDQSITLPINSIVLSGSGTDSDGSVVGYAWTKISGPAAFTILNQNQAQTIISDLLQGVYAFELRVTDNNGGTDRDTVNVTVIAATNRAPLAYAGDDKVVILPDNSVALDGNGIDPDGAIVSYKWKEIGGPAQPGLVNPNSPHTTVTNLTSGTYAFELEVMDNNGARATDTLRVIVKELPASKALIFPNPAKNIVNIRIEANTAANNTLLVIYDMKGIPVYREVFMRTQAAMTKQLDISHLASGSYIVEIAVDINRKVSLKLVKN